MLECEARTRQPDMRLVIQLVCASQSKWAYDCLSFLSNDSFDTGKGGNEITAFDRRKIAGNKLHGVHAFCSFSS
jgi:hypothetical protein